MIENDYFSGRIAAEEQLYNYLIHRLLFDRTANQWIYKTKTGIWEHVKVFDVLVQLIRFELPKELWSNTHFSVASIKRYMNQYPSITSIGPTPSEAPGVYENKSGVFLNTYTNMRYKSDKGDVESSFPFLQLVSMNICRMPERSFDELIKEIHSRKDKDGNPSEFAHLILSIAYIYNNPGYILQHAPTIIGGRGIAKSTFMEIMTKLIGNTFLVPQADIITRQWNRFLVGKELIFWDEIAYRFLKSKDLLDEWKKTIGNDLLIISGRNSDPLEVPNFSNHMIFSNHPISFGDDERKITAYKAAEGFRVGTAPPPAYILAENFRNNYYLTPDMKMDMLNNVQQLFTFLGEEGLVEKHDNWIIKCLQTKYLEELVVKSEEETEAFRLIEEESLFMEWWNYFVTPQSIRDIPSKSDWFYTTEELFTEYLVHHATRGKVVPIRNINPFGKAIIKYLPDVIEKTKKKQIRGWKYKNVI